MFKIPLFWSLLCNSQGALHQFRSLPIIILCHCWILLSRKRPREAGFKLSSLARQGVAETFRSQALVKSHPYTLETVLLVFLLLFISIKVSTHSLNVRCLVLGL